MVVPPKIGLVLALYNANVTTDWVAVAKAAARIPIRAIVPVDGVSPPDPDWAPRYPSARAYRAGVDMLRGAGVEVYAYTHLRNLSQGCCVCCGDLGQFARWVGIVKRSAAFDGIMLDNNDAPWSSAQPWTDDGLHRMYLPAARLVRAAGLGVWANGPHVSKDGTREASAAAWRPYLELASFTTLFEMPLAKWEAFPSGTNFSAELGWPAARLGGYVEDLPDDATAAKAIDGSLRLAVARGLGWLYPSITCKHRSGSCTYAELPSYWATLVGAIEAINRE